MNRWEGLDEFVAVAETGQFTAAAFKTAEIAAKAVLDEALAVFRRDAWDVAYGSSGTAGAVGDVLAAMGGPKGIITRSGLEALRDKLLRALGKRCVLWRPRRLDAVWRWAC